MQKIQYECDVCHAVKKDANHWWKALSKTGFHLYPWHAWNPQLAGTEPCIHLCGQECATQKLNEFMNAQPLADPPAVKKDTDGEPREFQPFIVQRADNLWYVVKGGALPDISFATNADAVLHLGRWIAIQQGAQPLEPDPAASTQTKTKEE